MSDSPVPSTRRSVLAGLVLPVAAGSAVLPIVSTPAVASRHEAAMLALGRALEDIDRLCNEADRRLDDAEERAPYRPEPEALIATNWDMGNALPMPTLRHDVRGRTWSRAQIEEIRSRVPMREDTVSARRRAEILAAYDARAAQVQADDEALGIPALKADCDTLWEKRRGIAARIIGTPCTGIAGLRVKARALVALYGEVPRIEATDADTVVAWKSIVADLMAMGDAA